MRCRHFHIVPRRSLSLPLLFAALVASTAFTSRSEAASGFPVGPKGRVVVTASAHALWTLWPAPNAQPVVIRPPTLELNGKTTTVTFSNDKVSVRQGATPSQWLVSGSVKNREDLVLTIRFEAARNMPLVRFSYALTAKGEAQTTPVTATSSAADDAITFVELSLAKYPQAHEVRLSEFVDVLHSYVLNAQPIEDKDFSSGGRVMGPIVAATTGKRSLLLAYEHGSAVPHAFIAYRLRPNRDMAVAPVKGGRAAVIDATHSFETVWFELAAQEGSLDALREAYRRFLKSEFGPPVSRQPLLYYNTWNYQERLASQGKRPFAEMTEARMLLEIEAAHRLGVEVFVIDDGWSTSPGDWNVDRDRFPRGLAPLRQKLEEHGMKLGLWIDPALASTATQGFKQHAALVASRGGVVPPGPGAPEMKTHRMCMVSAWIDHLADRLNRLVKEEGVSYFKWDGIIPSLCDVAGHRHGDASIAAKDRIDAYDFGLSGSLATLGRRVLAEHPGTIIDLDVTEDARPVGLEFLSVGRYFLMNNGPYGSDYDLPRGSLKGTSNVFFNAGPARGWITRPTFGYDSWLPLSLMLVHYFPDDPRDGQMMSLGSMILGHGGLWGELLGLSPQGAALVSDVVTHWKAVRSAMDETPMVRTGVVAGSPEVYEKVADSGSGAVVIFTTSGGTFEYVTNKAVNHRTWSPSPKVTTTFDQQGRAHLKAELRKNETAIVIFGP